MCPQLPGRVEPLTSSEHSLSPLEVIAVTQHSYSVNGISPLTVTTVLVVVTVSTVGR